MCDRLTLLYSEHLRGLHVRAVLPVIPWAMLRVRNEHSRAFRGRYSPEASPWGVEIVESQYWPHVRTVDVIGPPQSGKTFHSCELPVLYDLAETRETVFYMNGSEDNAKNIWRTRWLPTLRADTVLRKQIMERMDGGEWFERRMADGGLLYSTGPQSAAALAQRESRIVRCSELEKTPGALGNEASAYSLARDRMAAYPATHLVTSDCTVTVREGLSWRRFVAGDRSRPFVPCEHCGRYAMPAALRHLEESAFALAEDDVHLLTIPELAQASPDAAAEAARMICRACGMAFTERGFRAAMRAGVWVPVGCKVVRDDNPNLTPIPSVSWLDGLNRWAAESLANADIVQGIKDPPEPPRWRGPRLPDGVRLEWKPDAPSADATETLPGMRPDPRENPARSFWLWRAFAPKYSLGQVAREMVAGELGAMTGDVLDDQKNVQQKCYVLPYVEPIIGASEDLNEDAVLSCLSELPRGIAPRGTVGIVRAFDIGDDEIHWVLRAMTREGTWHLVDHGPRSADGVKDELTGLKDLRIKNGVRVDADDPVYQTLRRDVIWATLDRLMLKYADGVPDEDGVLHPIGLTYLDAGYVTEEIYHYCGRYHFKRMRPVKGRGGSSRLGRRRGGSLGGLWTDACEKKAVATLDATGRPMRHQYCDPSDARKLMVLDADYWKREVHSGIVSSAKASRGIPGIKPWFFVNAGLAPVESSPGSKLLRKDRYFTQVVAERWEEFQNPRTGRMERGWREYQAANHLLDCEAYALAAAGALGILPRYAAKITPASATAQSAVVPPHAVAPTPARGVMPPPVRISTSGGRGIRRAY